MPNSPGPTHLISTTPYKLVASGIQRGTLRLSTSAKVNETLNYPELLRILVIFPFQLCIAPTSHAHLQRQTSLSCEAREIWNSNTNQVRQSKTDIDTILYYNFSDFSAYAPPEYELPVPSDFCAHSTPLWYFVLSGRVDKAFDSGGSIEPKITFESEISINYAAEFKLEEKYIRRWALKWVHKYFLCTLFYWLCHFWNGLKF